MRMIAFVSCLGICGLLAPSGAAAETPQVWAAQVWTAQVQMPDVLPDVPEARPFEPSPFEPDIMEPESGDPDAAPPETGPDGEAPQADAGEDGTGEEGAPNADAQAARPDKPDLDTLFEMLANEDSKQARMRAAHRIQVMWAQSGSATVDLLMARAAKAMEKKEPALALDLLDAVVRFKPDYAAGWNRRAAAHFMSGDLGLALVDIERTLALEPRHWGALAGLAAIQRATDDDIGALRSYERILEIYPKQEKALEAAEDLRKKTGGREL